MPFPFPFLHYVPFFKYSHPFVPINCRIMTPTKVQSSSRCKGKKVAFDPPTTCGEGEEIVYSEPDSSDEEEAWCPSDSECAPLKDPGDYKPPLPGRVWLALYCRNTEASWVPHWLLRFPISSFARALYSPCLFILRLVY